MYVATALRTLLEHIYQGVLVGNTSRRQISTHITARNSQICTSEINNSNPKYLYKSTALQFTTVDEHLQQLHELVQPVTANATSHAMRSETIFCSIRLSHAIGFAEVRYLIRLILYLYTDVEVDFYTPASYSGGIWFKSRSGNCLS